jgi:hypothetical protein
MNKHTPTIAEKVALVGAMAFVCMLLIGLVATTTILAMNAESVPARGVMDSQ